MKDDFVLVKVTKAQFDYWNEKGSLVNAVKQVGDVEVCVTRKDWESYRGTVETFIENDFKSCWFPTKILEIAIHENYMEIYEKFNKEEM